MGTINKNSLLLLVLMCFATFEVTAQKTDSLFNLLPDAKGNYLADVLNNLSWELKYADVEKAFAFADSALKISTEEKYNEGMVFAYRNIGTLYYLTGDFEKSKENIDKAVEFADEYGFDFHKAKAINIMAIIYRDTKSYEDALIAFNQALDIFKKLGIRDEVNGVNHNIAFLYSEMDEHALSLEIYLDVLKSETDAGNISGIARTASNLGYEYDKIDSTKKAEFYFNLALEKAHEIENKNFEASALHGLASLFIENLDAGKAKECISQAMKINRELSNLFWLANNHFHFSKIMKIERKFDIARASLDSVIFYYDKIGLKDNIFVALYEKADLYFFQAKYAQAEESMETALNYYDENELESSQEYSSLLYYKILKEQNKLKPAIYWYEKYNEIITKEQQFEKEKAVLKVETLNRVNEIKRQNEHLRNENELKQKIINAQWIIFLISFIFLIFLAAIIFLLVKSRNKIKSINRSLALKNEEIETKSAQLAEANAMKDKFFSIIAHDLRNPFNALLGLSDLIVDEARRQNYADIYEYAQRLSETSQSTYDLLENLLEWSRSQRGAIQLEMKEINVLGEIKNTLDMLGGNINQKEIKIAFSIDPLTSIRTDERLLQVILRNVIGNAIKFTYRQGKITINSVKENGFVTISITDNGVGMDQATVRRLFRIDQHVSTPGTDDEKGSGLGLILCQEFVIKLGGKIWLESELHKGSKFHIQLPAA